MQIEVSVGGWEHLCCGRAIILGDDVAWEVQLYDGVYHETHHEPEPGSVAVTGRVTAIQARFDGGGSRLITRVPSGRALCGFDPDDRGELTAVDAGDPIGEVAGGFRVTLDVADDAALPA